VDWQKHASLPPDARTFTATTGKSVPRAAGKNYEFVKSGSGHYVGTVLNVDSIRRGLVRRRDDLFYVDGASSQLMGNRHRGYFNEAWGLRTSFSAWYEHRWRKASESARA